ncbi:thiamine diphosphokinase [Thioclava sp. GXIMD4216]|uniref:Thiamine diphosphokinase n=1 Tax=Thioclava litoralis TaxID=3076557 RepID=A0ABZ1E2M1_9RHOB|nr:thiamine diphosphokinase [Thioclava sp. FTW29]
MTESPVLSRKTGITLLGGGQIDPRDVYHAMTIAPHLVAADGGANQALALELMPEAVIGDMDSFDPAHRGRITAERLHHIAEQDSTDFGKCLRLTQAPFYLGLGFTGRRLDHTLAALSALAHPPRKKIILIDAEDIVFCAPPEMALTLPVQSRFSLYPLGPSAGTSTGLRWPIDGLTLEPCGQIGTSNEVTGPVTLQMTGPCLVLLPKTALGEALRALGCV